jgi:hypothetical protein
MSETEFKLILDASKVNFADFQRSAAYQTADVEIAYKAGFMHGEKWCEKSKYSDPVAILLRAYEKAWAASGKSYSRLNAGLWQILVSCINIGLEFQENDIETIYSECHGGYWFGASLNCKHQGEGLYRSANTTGNISAAKSFEKWRGRVPFISPTGERLSEGTDFKYQGLYWHVTGWNEGNDILHCAGYENSLKEGKRKLKKFTREQWIADRGNMTDFKTRSFG